LRLWGSISQAGDHPGQTMAAFSIFQHMNFIDHHRSHPPQALFSADHLIYALVGAGYYVSIKALDDLPLLSQTDATCSHPNGGLKAQFIISGELIVLLVGQGHQRHQKQ